MIRVSDIVEWILQNREGPAFRGYSKEKIICEIVEGMEQRTMAYAVTGKGEIVGVACGTKNDEKKIFCCTDVLTTEKGALKNIMNVFMNLYPSYIIEGTTRCGRKRVFNDPLKLTRRL